MNKSPIIKLLDSLESSVQGLETPKERADKLKKLLAESLLENKNYNLLSGTQKGLVEMFQEMNKMELTDDISNANKIIEHFETTGKFSLLSIPQNQFSKDLSEKFDSINLKLKQIIEGK